jgi:hypothetical protein
VESVSFEADLEPSDSIATPQLDSGESSSLSRNEDIGAMDRLFLDGRHRSEPFLGLIVNLASSMDFYAIAHFRKLGRGVPEGLPFVAMFPEFDPRGFFLPVAIDHRTWMDHCHGAFAKRLLANDGLLLAVGRGSDEDASRGLQTLGMQGFEGFSEPNGFLAWCWPSMLKRMSGSLSDQAIGRWMGNHLSGLIFPVEGGGRVEALVRPEISQDFQAFGFQ